MCNNKEVVSEEYKEYKAYNLSCDPDMYDVTSHFIKYGSLDFGVNLNIEPGCIVYLYFKKPQKSMAFKCIVTDVISRDEALYDSDFQNPNKPLKEKHNYLRLKYISNFFGKTDLVSTEALREHGLKCFQWPKELPVETIKYLESI